MRALPRTPPRATPAGPAETIFGSVSSLVYHNEQSGWTVASVAVRGGTPGGADTATVVGSCTNIWQGEEVKATGRWVRHPSHGLQFQADTLECVVPTSAEGLRRYLASGIIKGVGPKLADKIVDQFGEDTIRVLEKDSGRLKEIKGLGEAKRRAIKTGWDREHGARDAMIFLQGSGITSGASAKIYRQYGANTVAVVKENPYRLCDDVFGIGFLKADDIARKVGVPKDSPQRARAGLAHVLQALADEGHCFCEKPDLLLEAENLLSIPMETLETALADCIAENRFSDDGGRVYLHRLHRAERIVADRVLALLDTRASFRPIAADAAVGWVSKKLSFALSPAQDRAVRMALESKFSIVTGGPGVGKTTIIRALAEIWCAKELDVRLVAPTGRAARRMAESTGREAQTIHRLLKWNPAEARFTYTADNPLPADVLVVDETSMIDVELAASLFSALRPTTTVVLVGDTDQLPSVGPGNVLRDLIASGVVPCTRLDVVFRQKTGGWIVRNAHRVNEGKGFETPPRGEFSDFFFVPCEDPDKTLRLALELVERRIPARYNLSPLQDIQVLTPMRKNMLGADNLNAVLQQGLNPHGPAIVRAGRAYRVGDRVMQMRNDYDKDVFNGDVGFVRAVDPDGPSLDVDFDGTVVNYSAAELDELVHAFATSIHKSQGSEYPAVVIVLSTQHFKLLQRNLLYTAITRGKKLVCVVGSPRAVGLAIRNNETVRRRTALAERLKGPLPPLVPPAPVPPAPVPPVQP
ncbi:MAG: ATP-dependent RecD-like DNA helicase [Kiritimatiellae bacterium]|nr:ATP-dependent RecD-like DNA helicase [Kiritimatiellia bacterium]